MTDDHAAIRALVERIRRETGRRVPDVDPDGPGARARVLIVFRDPPEQGPGPLATNVMSAARNRDSVARSASRLNAEAGLPDGIVVAWNAVPWDLGDRRGRPNADDRRRGVAYLKALVALLPELRAVVACGTVAHESCRRAGLNAIEVCMPSTQGFNSAPGNRERYVAGLREAAARAVG